MITVLLTLPAIHFILVDNFRLVGRGRQDFVIADVSSTAVVNIYSAEFIVVVPCKQKQTEDVHHCYERNVSDYLAVKALISIRIHDLL